MNWIDNGNNRKLGDVGFLVESFNQNNQTETLSLQREPARKNMSGEQTLVGWCGDWNNIGTYNRGLARVVRVAKNERIAVRSITDQVEVSQCLETLGFPDLVA